MVDALKKSKEQKAEEKQAGKDEVTLQKKAVRAKQSTAKKAARKSVAESKAPAKKKSSAAKTNLKTSSKSSSKKSSTRPRAAGKAAAKRPGGKRRTIPGSDAEESSAAEMDPFERARQTMKGSVPAIVEAMVEQAKRGSCPHAKTLLEMTGAKQFFGGDAEPEERGEPWAKLVLEHMIEAEQKELQYDSKQVPQQAVAEPQESRGSAGSGRGIGIE